MFAVLFLVAFVRMVLMAMNTRNIVQNRYLSAWLVSASIGALWIVSVAVVVRQMSLLTILAECFGGATGTVVGMYLHKRLYK